MKINTIRNSVTLLLLLTVSFGLAGCDKFLDRVPDNRAEVDTNAKVAQLLVSAYPNLEPMLIYYFRTDDVMDNGRKYGFPSLDITQGYSWEKMTDTEWDGPEALWSSCYHAINASNQAIEEMTKIGRSKENDPHYAEALLTRAYSHFLLVNTFAKPYDPATASKDLGIPYVTKVEKAIGETAPRGTLQETYDHIAADIEEGYPLLDDALYQVPKYHFNRKAASAFAARFYLYMGKWEKAVEYANKAIDADPSATLRDLKAVTSLSGASEWRDQFISKDEAANLMLVSLRSLYGRTYHSSQRISTSEVLMGAVLYRSPGPWGQLLPQYDLIWGTSGMPTKYWPKYNEQFEITNKTAQTGQPHVTTFPFTTDETLLVRAEAEVWLKQYDAAARDLSYYFVDKGGSAATVEQIVKYYTDKRAEEAKAQADEKNPLSPWLCLVKDISSPFGIEAGTQEAMLQCVLHTRRIETLFSGQRWLDIRRYNIEVVHNRAEQEPIVLKPGDPRYVIQIPDAVIAAGMEPNPEK